MEVNAVTSSINEHSKVNFGHNREQQRQYLERFANLNDKELRTIAYKEAGVQVNDKKHKRISNAMFFSLPLVAGLNSAINSDAIGRIPRLKAFGSTAAIWGVALGVFEGVRIADNYLYDHSKSKRKFDNNHPILSALGRFTVWAGLATMTSLGLMSARSKFGPKLVEQLKKAKVDKFINESKALGAIRNGLNKVPSALKEAGKFIADISPMAVIIANIAHSFNHTKVKNMVANENYCDLKLKQSAVRQALALSDIAEEL